MLKIKSYDSMFKKMECLDHYKFREINTYYDFLELWHSIKFNINNNININCRIPDVTFFSHFEDCVSNTNNIFIERIPTTLNPDIYNSPFASNYTAEVVGLNSEIYIKLQEADILSFENKFSDEYGYINLSDDVPHIIINMFNNNFKDVNSQGTTNYYDHILLKDPTDIFIGNGEISQAHFREYYIAKYLCTRDYSTGRRISIPINILAYRKISSFDDNSDVELTTYEKFIIDGNKYYYKELSDYDLFYHTTSEYLGTRDVIPVNIVKDNLFTIGLKPIHLNKLNTEEWCAEQIRKL